ncbi:MAG: DUF1893 domain-containing protein [Bacteroides sp.]|nr:DUF1893 domain-containing protein [Bacteroides sp.]
MTIAQLRDSAAYSLVVATASGQILTFKGRGVSDLYDLYTTRPSVLAQADVADKVVGAGAAVLLALGRVRSVDAPVISSDALAILRREAIRVTGFEEVPAIINRTATGRCPLETLIASTGINSDLPHLLPVITRFVESMRRK